jgi:hypothetical protein
MTPPTDRSRATLTSAVSRGSSLAAEIRGNSRFPEAEALEFVESIEREGKRVICKHASAIAAFGMPTRIVDRAARANRCIFPPALTLASIR